jgi:NAD(P)H-dependent flavin oxidoreductase YrpB (nitropropane dioxygenase family)
MTKAHPTGPAPTQASNLPTIIQGGMGVAISDWRLAGAVTRAGQLGLVSGTALEVVLARRLQDGDQGGHVRRALAAFPTAAVSEWILKAYFQPGGRADGELYRAVPRFTLQPAQRLVELTVAANFVEVYLAKEAGGGPVGINYLRKIEMPLLTACYGALLAGVDYIVMGAGNPADLPGLVRRLSRHQEARLPIRVQGARSSDGPYDMVFDPTSIVGPGRPALPEPRNLAIVASSDLARALAENPQTRPDGFVIEGPSAGGHNAPPRGPRRTDEQGQPVYDDRDVVEVAEVVALGLPVWLAGSFGTPDGLRAALAAGAVGVQVGTAFALCVESGLDPALKAQVQDGVRNSDLATRSDWRVSPTGFPFRVADLPGTLSDPQVVAERTAVCDLGMLRSAYLEPEGAVGYRCPAEPASAYGRKGGREATAAGRVCLCNALFSTAGFAQRRKNGYVEPGLVTAGSDLRTVATLLARSPEGYRAADVVGHLLAHPHDPASAGSVADHADHADRADRAHRGTAPLDVNPTPAPVTVG